MLGGYQPYREYCSRCGERDDYFFWDSGENIFWVGDEGYGLCKKCLPPFEEEREQFLSNYVQKMNLKPTRKED
jgi:hypothetical protein